MINKEVQPLQHWIYAIDIQKKKKKKKKEKKRKKDAIAKSTKRDGR